MNSVKHITVEHSPGVKTCWTAQSATYAILKDFRVSAKRWLAPNEFPVQKNRAIDPQYKLLS